MTFSRFLHSFACVLSLSASLIAASAASSVAGVQDDAAREGFRALSEGRYDQAVTLYTGAISSRELEPEVLANALLNKALALQHLQQHEAAIADYSAALELDAMSPQLRATAHYNRGLSRHKLKKLPDAIEDYTSALMLSPSMAHAFLSRGNALRDSGQYLFALSDYERALRFEHPDPARVHYASALTYTQLRRSKDALASLQQALKANPAHAPSLKLIGQVSAQVGAIEASDQMSTGSISAMSSTTLQKPAQAIAVAPQPALMNTPVETESVPVSKKIQDRLPEEVVASVAAPIVAGPETKPLPEETQPMAEAVSAAPEVPEAQSKAVELGAQVGWAVQFASASSEEGARETWAKMQSKHKVLRDILPMVVRADLGTKGVFYRVRLNGFEDQSAAKAICQKIKRGGADCYVSKAGR